MGAGSVIESENALLWSTPVVISGEVINSLVVVSENTAVTHFGWQVWLHSRNGQDILRRKDLQGCDIHLLKVDQPACLRLGNL
jgi:hypothetical protein